MSNFVITYDDKWAESSYKVYEDESYLPYCKIVVEQGYIKELKIYHPLSVECLHKITSEIYRKIENGTGSIPVSENMG